jgi:hypothetical protein
MAKPNYAFEKRQKEIAKKKKKEDKRLQKSVAADDQPKDSALTSAIDGEMQQIASPSSDTLK